MGAQNFISAVPNLGVEAQLSLSSDNTLEYVSLTPQTCEEGAFGPIQCDASRKLRLRATYHFYLTENLELNFAAGPVWVEADRAVGFTTTVSETYRGYSSGLGLTYNFDGHGVRLMLNWDEYGGDVGGTEDLKVDHESAELIYIRSF